MKNIVILLILGCASLAVAGDKNDLIPTVYGKVVVSYGIQDVNGADDWELKSHSSRIGVKGKYDLTDSLKAIYKLEWEVDVTDNSEGSNNNIKSRNQFVGLNGSFGTFLFGRHDTPTKVSQGKFDLFNDLDSDIKYLTAADIRASNVIAYSSPKLGDTVNMMLAIVPGEEPDGADGPADAVSANITYSKNGFFGGIGLDSEVGGMDTIRATLIYKTKKFQFGGLFDSTELVDGSSDADAFIVNASYQANKTRFKVQFGNSDIGPKGKGLGDLAYQGTESISVGADYLFSKKAFLFAYYVSTDDDGGHESDFMKVGGSFKF